MQNQEATTHLEFLNNQFLILNNKTQIGKIDSLELLQCTASSHEYPLHYHDTFCISLIQEGLFGENDTIASKGTLLISNPYEVHQNRLIHETAYSLTTFYINSDLFRSIYPSKDFSFKEKIINNDELFQSFSKSVTDLSLISKDIALNKTFEQDFFDILHSLFYQYSSPIPYTETHTPDSLHEIKNYILENIDQKIQLNELAKIAGKDKFKFIRWFKKHIGLTPFDFIILNRIEAGKKMIKEGKPLTDTALDTGFYDQSNFSNYFKYFVGVTPKDYQRSCNIFQDLYK